MSDTQMRLTTKARSQRKMRTASFSFFKGPDLRLLHTLEISSETTRGSDEQRGRTRRATRQR